MEMIWCNADGEGRTVYTSVPYWKLILQLLYEAIMPLAIQIAHSPFGPVS